MRKAGIEDILIEALPYIRRFYGAKIVIKIGGHALINDEMMESITKDIVLLKFVGINPVIVHGGGPEITKLMEKLGRKPKFVAGLRITDEETLKIARMVLVGDVNEKIVSLIGKHGGKAVGLSGNDGNLIVARRKEKLIVHVEGKTREVDLGWVGDVEKINAEIVEILSERGYIPVIAPVAVDSNGNSLNVNADTVAGEIANALNASKFILLTDVPGILRNSSDESSLISEISCDELRRMIADGVISEGMIPKVQACLNVVESSPSITCHIIDGRRRHSLLLELFTDEGIGTMIVGSNV